MQLRTWLMKSPRPTVITCTTANGDTTLEIQPGQSWVNTAQTIAALEPLTVKAFNGDKFLRAVKLEELDPGDDGADDDGSLNNHHTVQRAVAPNTPDGQLLGYFAGLIAEAYRHSTEVAFAKMVEVFHAVNTRTDLLEKQIDRVSKENANLRDEILELSEDAIVAQHKDPLEQALSAFAGGVTAGQDSVQKPNGKAAHS